MAESQESGASRFGGAWSRFVADYGMVFVLLLLCVFFSWLTRAEQYPNDARGAERLVALITDDLGPGTPVLVVARDNDEDRNGVVEMSANIDDSTPDMIAGLCARLLDEGAIVSVNGRRLPTAIDSICVHGDGAEAVQAARALRDGLAAAGRTVVPLDRLAD